MQYRLIVATTLAVLSGCVSTPPPASFYQSAGKFSALTQKCFDAEYISPLLYSQTKEAFGYMLGTQNYDQATLSTAQNHYYAHEEISSQVCRQVEAHAYKLLSDATNHREQKKSNSEAWQKAFDNMNSARPVYCNTIGSTTVCN